MYLIDTNVISEASKKSRANRGVGDGGVVVLGLLSSAEPVVLQGRPHLAVKVPTAPVPGGGGCRSCRRTRR